MKNTIAKSVVALAALAAIGGGAGLAALASAQTASTTGTATPTTQDHRMGMHGPWGKHDRGVHGTVSAVNGNTVTITNTDGTSYTVDASNAKISKMVDLNVSDIKVGDTLGVQGSVNGTSVTATHIMDGIPPMPQGPPTTTQ